MKSGLLFLSLLLSATPMAAERVLYLSLEANKHNEIIDSKSGASLKVYGRFGCETVAGAVGKALRFDGYSTYAQGDVKSLGTLSKATFSIWVAPETYPVIEFDTPTAKKTTLAGTYDETARQGWSFCLGYTGKYSFKAVSGSWPLELEADDILPRNEWSHITAVFDGETRTLTLYRNGNKVGEKRVMDTLDCNATAFMIGKNPDSRGGNFYLDTFNGLIDDIEVYDEPLSEETIAATVAENPADLTIPTSRFESNLLRPKFHGMPAAGWTNETHGMTYSNGRYHLFFQKNANGPYMTRLHWGHISSDNLYDWTEEPITIAPAESYDVKGCWSGCVFSDDEITAGKPNAIYTAVDYAKAVIAQASPLDDDLIEWEKKEGNPIINGRPAGLSDDFRDPYFFRNGENAYIVVGTSKDNIGAATLHKYDKVSGTWSNTGKIFFQGQSKAQDGRFWEMPTVTKMDNGKWLVTVTPLETATGVHTLYWTGDINADGTFSPDATSSTPRDFELISKDGYGLLSPTIYQHDGKTIALGIVPDKVATSENCKWGWAHLYSFPRELTLDSEGNLVQKPFDGLRDLRSTKSEILNDVEIEGVKTIEGVIGRQVELYGKFEVGSSIFGFNIFKNASGEGVISYNPATNELTADFSALQRLSNDNGVYNGVYRTVLPERPATGSEMTLDVFIDGSIVDIFVNDKWATSIRVYPNDNDADGVEVFSNGVAVKASQIGAWVLESGSSAGIGDIWNDATGNTFRNGPVEVYTMTGQRIRVAATEEEAISGLDKGIYLVSGRKVLVK